MNDLSAYEEYKSYLEKRYLSNSSQGIIWELFLSQKNNFIYRDQDSQQQNLTLIKKTTNQMKKDEFERILDEYNFIGQNPSSDSMHQEKQVGNLIFFHIFEGDPLLTNIQKESHQAQSSRFQRVDHPAPNHLPGKEQTQSFNKIMADVQQITVEDSFQNSSSEYSPRLNKLKTQSRAFPKPPKNQYDKNIFGNITKTVIKQILSGNYEEQIRQYCLMLGISYRAFLDIFIKMDRQCIRLGTSELNHLLHSQHLLLGFRKAFSYFLVRYLREEYLLYVIQEGRMRDKAKYIFCASKMLYIPRLTLREYRYLATSNQQQMQ